MTRKGKIIMDDNKENCLCKECIAEIKKIASELNQEQMEIARASGMTAFEYVEYMN